MHALLQPLPQFRQGQIRLYLQLPPHILFHRLRRSTGRAMEQLLRPLRLSRLQLLPPNLLCKAVANTELFRQPLETDLGPFVCLQNLAPQIIRICSWHLFVSSRRNRRSKLTPLYLLRI